MGKLAALLALVLVAAAGAVNNRGVFDIACTLSHSSFDDPIMHPGVPGGSDHEHNFVGFTKTDAFSEADQMIADLENDRSLTSCSEREGREDPLPRNATGYWVPSASVNGQRVPVSLVHNYYQCSGRACETIPTGLKFIVRDEIRFYCRRPHFGLRAKIPPVCNGKMGFAIEVITPPCWDGRLDSPDHISHLAYEPCPPTHKRRLPRISAHFTYRAVDIIGRRLQIPGDVVKLSCGELECVHADFLSAWVPDRIQFLVDECLNKGLNCKRNPPESGL